MVAVAGSQFAAASERQFKSSPQSVGLLQLESVRVKRRRLRVAKDAILLCIFFFMWVFFK